MLTGNVLDIRSQQLSGSSSGLIEIRLKGCSLSCIGCHCPEGVGVGPELRYSPESCKKCGACVGWCKPHAVVGNSDNSGSCVACGRCVEFCPTGALHICGHVMTVAQTMAIVMAHLSLLSTAKTEVVVSGGEPLHQGEYLLGLLRKLKKTGAAVTLKTCGVGELKVLKKAAGIADKVQYRTNFLAVDRCSSMNASGIARGIQNVRRLIDEDYPVELIRRATGANLFATCPTAAGAALDLILEA